ncbi:tRNA dihydrouridine synthase DusB [Candidatus Desantisbacteria bacterium]|nr:tRNA dihydrouridine synthase DusB [Candidatus Desantisbacteria bacterium]
MLIGKVSVENNLIFAPLSGITDSPTRIIARCFGAGLVFSEMISCEGLIRHHKKTEELLYFTPEERPIAFQIFGFNPENMADAAFIAYEKGADIIDLNFGCPVKKIIKSKSGSYLLQFPEKIAKIIACVRRKINIPLTIKIRAGWDLEHVNACDIAKIAQDEGADAVIIHPRTQTQMFRGISDWEIIRKVKNTIQQIPVIGNGDILTPQDASRMFNETGCDAVMIGRGALGNPWIFKNIEHFIKTGEILNPPAIEEKIKMALHHMESEVQYKGEKRGVRESYKVLFWYLKGLPDAVSVRQKIIKHDNFNEIKNILEKYMEDGVKNE